jgi:hypothetical protein
MNEQDNEAFEKWWGKDIYDYDAEDAVTRFDAFHIWQAAIEHERAKSQRLVEALITIDKRLDNAEVINPAGLVHAMIKTRLADYKKGG